MIESNLKKFCIYSRKSKFTGKGESIENQIELCRQYIRVNYGELDINQILIYEDEGFSGGTLERPKFKEMMEDAKKGCFSVIVCYRLDRISRNIGDFAKLIEELNEMKISFVSIKEQFDTSSPMGRAMMYIASVFSQLERETIAERIRDNMHELSKTGRWLGGTTPTGYVSESIENVTIDGKVKKACKLKLIPEEAELIKIIFNKFLEVNSLTKTETYLIQNGYNTKNENLFSRFTIKGILTNPVYMIADEEALQYLKNNNVELFAQEVDFDGKHGIMAYNRTIQKQGKAHQLREMNEWIVSVGKHKGIISGADWVKAQKLLDQNRSKTYRKPRSNVALLSGLLFCGNCGDYMRPKLSKRFNSEGEQIYSYLCSMKERSRMHSCDCKNANGNMLDSVIIEEIKKLAEDDSEFVKQLNIGKKALIESNEEYHKDIEQLKQFFDENEKEIKRLVLTLGKVAGTATEDYVFQQLEELHKKNERYKQRIEELEGLTKSHVLSDIEFDLLKQLLSSFKDSIDNMDIEQKRAAVRTFVKKVIWDGKNVHIYLFGSDEEYEFPQEPIGKGNLVQHCANITK